MDEASSDHINSCDSFECATQCHTHLAFVRSSEELGRDRHHHQPVNASATEIDTPPPPKKRNGHTAHKSRTDFALRTGGDNTQSLVGRFIPIVYNIQYT